MNRISFAALRRALLAVGLIGGFHAGAVHGDSGQCIADCRSDRAQCATLGPDAGSNCGDGLRLCLQRCDPQRLNADLLSRMEGEFTAVARRAPGLSQAARNEQRCEQACDMTSMNCSSAGNDASHCRLARQACTQRCSGS